METNFAKKYVATEEALFPAELVCLNKFRAREIDMVLTDHRR